MFLQNICNYMFFKYTILMIDKLSYNEFINLSKKSYWKIFCYQMIIYKYNRHIDFKL